MPRPRCGREPDHRPRQRGDDLPAQQRPRARPRLRGADRSGRDPGAGFRGGVEGTRSFRSRAEAPSLARGRLVVAADGTGDFQMVQGRWKKWASVRRWAFPHVASSRSYRPSGHVTAVLRVVGCTLAARARPERPGPRRAPRRTPRAACAHQQPSSPLPCCRADVLSGAPQQLAMWGEPQDQPLRARSYCLGHGTSAPRRRAAVSGQ